MDMCELYIVYNCLLFIVYCVNVYIVVCILYIFHIVACTAMAQSYVSKNFMCDNKEMWFDLIIELYSL